MASANTPTTTGSSIPTTASGLGKTVIADSVVAKVAGIAASTVPGVFALGGGAARALGAIRGAIGGDTHAQGISVEVGELQVAADVQIVAEYPTPLQGVADGVRSAVIEAIETLVGLEVTEVNVTINDVHIPSDDKDEDETAEARVL